MKAIRRLFKFLLMTVRCVVWGVLLGAPYCGVSEAISVTTPMSSS